MTICIQTITPNGKLCGLPAVVPVATINGHRVWCSAHAIEITERRLAQLERAT
jgi:hypothetical protein